MSLISLKLRTAVCMVTAAMMAQPILSVAADSGEIIIGRDVPAQRFDGIRHTGRATTVNPSPVKETNTVRDLLNNNQPGITELTDQQSSNITSDVGTTLSPSQSPLNSVLIANQLSSSHSKSPMTSQIGNVTGMTRGIGGSVGDATRSATGAIGDILSGTSFGN